MKGKDFKIIIPRRELQKKIKELGKRISEDYSGKEPILIGILKGSFIFLADLIRVIKVPHEVDFMAVASYGQEIEGSGVVKLIKDLNINIEGKDVIIIEDIVDTGLTLNFIKKNLLLRNPRSLEIAALLDRKERRKVQMHLKYVGFTVPNEFVVGYGLDLAERYRNLPYIAKIEGSKLAQRRFEL
ncbi:MAG: hypoxanthine phosphoribosyltransferase [candidate division Zixibacteria bacterium]|nr:hypoxanthine phosphoribosyltransferase [candidate division Zixibacteria bacterium]